MSIKATIVVPTYNRAHTLALTLASLVGQSDAARIVVLDDASTDATPDVCLRHGGVVEYRRNSRRLGLFGNWNAGLKVARTPYVAIYHDDDIYENGIVRKSIATLDRYPSAGFVHTACTYIDDDGRQVGRHTAPWAPLTSGHAFRRVLAGRLASPVVAPSVMLRRESALAVGGFDEGLRVCGDLVMWMELARSADVAYLAEPLVRFRRRGRFANEHARVNWDILGEHVAVGARTQRDVYGRLGLRFRIVRTAYLAQFVARDVLEPAEGNQTTVLAREGSPVLCAAARLARPGSPAAPLLRFTRPAYAAAVRAWHNARALRGS